MPAINIFSICATLFGIAAGTLLIVIEILIVLCLIKWFRKQLI